MSSAILLWRHHFGAREEATESQYRVPVPTLTRSIESRASAVNHGGTVSSHVVPLTNEIKYSLIGYTVHLMWMLHHVIKKWEHSEERIFDIFYTPQALLRSIKCFCSWRGSKFASTKWEKSDWVTEMCNSSWERALISTQNFMVHLPISQQRFSSSQLNKEPH